MREAGLHVVVHDDHFRTRQNVGDPEVIAECGANGWYLLTGDNDLTRRWSKEIIKAGIGVFCQTNNHQGPRLWIPRLLYAKESMLRAARKWERPFIAFIPAEPKPKLNRKDLLVK